MCHWRKWILPGLFSVLLIAAAALWLKTTHIQTDLADGAQRAFADAGAEWASVSMEGRDATLIGEALDEQSRLSALSLADEISEIRVVMDATKLQPAQSPYTFSVISDASAVALHGFIPSAGDREALVADVKSLFPGKTITDSLKVARGAKAGFSDAVTFGLKQLAQLADGEFRMRDQTLELTGTAGDFVAYDTVEKAVETSLPDGATLQIVEINAPSVSPYLWAAEYDGKQVALTGYVPTKTAGKKLFDAVLSTLPDASIINSQKIASGAPAEFLDAARFAIRQLGRFGEGSVGLKDKQLKIEGKAHSTKAYSDALEALLGELPAGLEVAAKDIQPPSIGSYFWSVNRSDGRLSLEGLVPTEDLRAAILKAAEARFPGTSIEDEMKIANGAPDGFGATVRFSLQQLERVTAGTVILTGDELSIVGQARDSVAYEAARNALKTAIPKGFSLARDGISPPVISPYVWSAELKTSKLVLAGHVPDESARRNVVAEAQKSFPNLEVIDELAIGTGEPSDVMTRIAFALQQLSLLSSGKVRTTDDQLHVEGTARDVDAYVSAQAALTGALPAGLQSGTVTIEPAAVESFGWNVRRDRNSISISGFVPSEETRKSLIKKANAAFPDANVADRMQVASGAPTNFELTTTGALEALKRFEEGQVDLFDGVVTVSGTASSPQDFDVAEKFASAGLPGGVVVASADINPSVAKGSYFWSVERTGSDVVLTGSVPSSEARVATTDKAKSILPGVAVTDRMRVEGGEPERFMDIVSRAAELMIYLESGRVEIQNSELSIEGRAADFEAYDKVRARIDGDEWGEFAWAKQKIEPTIVKPFTWSVERDGGSTSLKGYARDENQVQAQVRAAEKALGGSVFNNLRIAAGEAQGSNKAITAAIAAVARLQKGRAAITDDNLDVQGIAPSAEDAKSIRTDIEREVPNNFRVETRLSFPANPVTNAKDKVVRELEDPLEQPQDEPDEIAVAVPAKRPDDAPVPKSDPVKPSTTGCAFDFAAILGKEKILFALGRAEIKPKSYPLLDRIVKAVKACPGTKFEISGHTDSYGKAAFNIELSLKRAKAVATYMANAGFDARNLTVEGFGRKRPIATNDTELGRALNRRIEIKTLN